MKPTKLFYVVLFFFSSFTVTSQSLIFSYDLAGNQKQRFYCPNSGSCAVPTPPTGKIANEEKIAEEDIEEDIIINNLLSIYPNPTKDIVYIQMQSDLNSQIESINIYNSNSSLIKSLTKDNTNQNLEVDLTGIPTGVYFLHIHLKGTNSITKKIIKE